MSSYTYRKLWIQYHNRPIPIDANNRTFEIHHVDGNRSNNHIDNLQCLSIEEHYEIHYKQGDWGACVMIAKRLSLPSDHLSNIQQGKKRPGVGGVKKGTIPWNKGKTYKTPWNENRYKKHLIQMEKNSKISQGDAEIIRSDFEKQVLLENQIAIGVVQRNGKPQTYTNLFCIEYGKKYGVTSAYIKRIIKGLVKCKLSHQTQNIE